MNIKVLSFNVRTCDDPNGHAIKERGPRDIEILREADADIMGFQEYTPKMAAEIESALTGKYEIFSKLRAEESGADGESVPILWKKDRFDCLDKGYFWFSDTPEKESKGWDEIYDCYRICMWAVLKDKQTHISFIYINTHFGFGDKGQCDSVRLIKEYAHKIGNFPVIITGDFNMTPESLPYAEMVKYFDDVNAKTANYKGITFHNYSTVPTEKQAHIDYCFVNNKVSPISYKVITKTFDGKFPSDHYPIAAELKIDK